MISAILDVVQKGTVYLLCYGDLHYIGWTQNLKKRISEHKQGEGCIFTTRLHAEGKTFSVVRIWKNATKADERTFKAKLPKHFCPNCSIYIKGLLPVSTGVINYAP